MMDIVETLRRDAKVTQNAQYRRAADEIERLRTATAEMGRVLNLARERETTLRAERDALKAENNLLQAAQGILKAERDELRAARISYASLFPPNADGEPDVGSIHENIRKLIAERDALKAELEFERSEVTRLRQVISVRFFDEMLNYGSGVLAYDPLASKDHGEAQAAIDAARGE